MSRAIILVAAWCDCDQSVLCRQPRHVFLLILLMVILRMNNSICEGRGRIFISIEFAIRSIPGDRDTNTNTSSHVHLRSHHAGMALACGAGEVRLDLYFI